MKAPWLLVHVAILADRRQLGSTGLQKSRLVSSISRAAELVDAGYDGHSWLAKAPDRASWKGGRALDAEIQIGDFSEVSIQFKPRGHLVFEAHVPLGVAEQQFTEASAEESSVQFFAGIIQKFLDDAGHRWQIGLPRPIGETPATGGRHGTEAVLSVSEPEGASKLIVEIHVPLDSRTESLPGIRNSAWIDDVQEFLVELDEEVDGAEPWDDGDEWFGNYVFFIAGQDENKLLEVASRAATLEGVPTGAFAVVTSEEAGAVWGDGDRIPLPARRT